MIASPDRILCCTVGGETCGLAVGQVAEILDPVPLQPIPRTPPCFSGMMLIHGVPVPVLDLASYLEIGPGIGAGQVLVVAPDLATLALRVDGVERIEPAAAFVPAPAMVARLTAAGCLAADAGHYLDLPRLVERLAILLAGR